jgi:uncharacterized protein with GYD domain
MMTFIMLTRLSHETVGAPQQLEEREKQVMQRIRQECPDVQWVHNYAVLGPYDYLDIFAAPDIETATKISTLVRTYGHAHSEIWPATEWAAFKEILHHLPGEAA